MCILCPTPSGTAVLCREHEIAWEASPEFRRVEWFRQHKDTRLSALLRSALTDFINRRRLELLNGTEKS
jgi:hypothetical protein